MPKFTPGPWKWVSDYATEDCERGPVDLLTFRQETNNYHYYGNVELEGPDGVVLGCDEYDILGGSTREQRAANGRLIAAAPNGLKLAQALYDLSDSADLIPYPLKVRFRKVCFEAGEFIAEALGEPGHAEPDDE